MPELREASNSYFLSGDWMRELESGLCPVLLDPSLYRSAFRSQVQSEMSRLEVSKNADFFLATSGSTGKPKLIAKTWVELQKERDFWNSDSSPLPWREEAGLCIQVAVPLCFLYGLLWGFLVRGEEWIFDHSGEPKEGIDLLVTTPKHLATWRRSGVELPRYILSSGAIVSPGLAREIRFQTKSQVFEIYGSSETGAIAYRDPLWKARFSFLPGVQTRYEDEIGLLVQTPWMSSHSQDGYLLNEQGFYPTGDFGDLNGDGFSYLGRKDRIIKRNGKRVSLDAIQSLAEQAFPGEEFAVVSLKNSEAEEKPFLFWKESPFFHPELLQNSLKQSLPNSFLPEAVIAIPEFPLLPSQKIDYNELQRRLDLDPDRWAEKKDRALHPGENWKEYLHQALKNIKPGETWTEDSVFATDLGMSSLDILELLLFMEKKLGRKIPPEERNTGFFTSLQGIYQYLEAIGCPIES